MKAEELMLGDWVSCDGSPRKVVAIAGDHIGVRKTTEEGLSYIAGQQIGKVSPVTLSAEILDKNGFRPEGAVHRLNGKGYAVGVSLEEPCEIHIRIGASRLTSDYAHIEARYVHQLQHALRLFGVGLDIVL
ncbi:MAG: hypothetical protein IKZ67_03660 [Paludibacteraceae bacterium]|nr:hypothetical protein [Paludibacteraceae bacterium]